ncbi:hypothetical protein H4R24_000518 [Coemansia sp. RSA 988]|nr:hypothetical protein H4R24_000518 [Coemansia sp. RSA 988]
METINSKSELAGNVAEWATHELGFRKSTTLVTAKGEEKITSVEVEPLLQGELAIILDKASRHLISSQNAERSRRRIAAFCAQSSGDKDIQSLQHVALTRELTVLNVKKQTVSADIKGIELDNHSTIRNINEIEAKRRAAESRIREHRLQILKKQLMAERLRRMTSRMRILTQEMRSGADTVQAPDTTAGTTMTVHGASVSYENDSDSPSVFLSSLISRLKAIPAGSQYAANSTQKLDDTNTLEQTQSTIANIIYLLKRLEDQHLEMWTSVRTKRSQLDVDQSKLFEKLEEIASQLRINSATDSDMNYDYKISVLQAVLRDAVAQVDKTAKMLFPVLKIAETCTWTSNEHSNKAQEIAKTIKLVKNLAAASRNEAAEVKKYAGTDVADTHQHFVQALRYVDLRSGWDSIRLSDLQLIYLESSDGGKEDKAVSGKLIAHSCFSGVERDRRLCDIAHETTAISNQAHETTVERLGQQAVQVNDSQRDVGDKSLVAAVDGLRTYSQDKRASASTVMEEWMKTSKVMQHLQTAKNSAETEEEIAELSDISGRLFTETFAPWYRRDGVSYAEYLKQLKIARTSDKQSSDGQSQSP